MRLRLLSVQENEDVDIYHPDTSQDVLIGYLVSASRRRIIYGDVLLNRADGFVRIETNKRILQLADIEPDDFNVIGSEIREGIPLASQRGTGVSITAGILDGEDAQEQRKVLEYNVRNRSFGHIKIFWSPGG